ncbi:MAG: hypothetical protein R8J94_14770 [Acidimicrobiia bacterium]|nr:hypothetical protein [Acidimicrobiia bacterium]
MMRYRSLALLPLAFVFLAAACGTGDDETAIALSATTASGGQIDFNSLEGNDVVLWFWAPW